MYGNAYLNINKEFRNMERSHEILNEIQQKKKMRNQVVLFYQPVEKKMIQTYSSFGSMS